MPLDQYYEPPSFHFQRPKLAETTEPDNTARYRSTSSATLQTSQAQTSKGPVLSLKELCLRTLVRYVAGRRVARVDGTEPCFALTPTAMLQDWLKLVACQSRCWSPYYGILHRGEGLSGWFVESHQCLNRSNNFAFSALLDFEKHNPGRLEELLPIWNDVVLRHHPQLAEAMKKEGTSARTAWIKQ